jgi:hypothetical protein
MTRAFFIFIFCLFPSALSAEPNRAIVWSNDRTALAFCDDTIEASCFVVCNDKLANVSSVEKGNIGKLGSNNKYEKILTLPVRWESNDEVGCMFWFKTHAWLNGQRFTVEEPVYVTKGKFIQR